MTHIAIVGSPRFRGVGALAWELATRDAKRGADMLGTATRPAPHFRFFRRCLNGWPWHAVAYGLPYTSFRHSWFVARVARKVMVLGYDILKGLIGASTLSQSIFLSPVPSVCAHPFLMPEWWDKWRDRKFRPARAEGWETVGQRVAATPPSPGMLAMAIGHSKVSRIGPYLVAKINGIPAYPCAWQTWEIGTGAAPEPG